MASENQANYARVGLAVVLGVVATIVALVYIGGVGQDQNQFLLETCYDKPVSGLSVGSTVNFRGVKIGEVREIGFIGAKYRVEGEDCQLIYVLMAIDGNMINGYGGRIGMSGAAVIEKLVANGLRATVSASGITGLSRIEFNLDRTAECRKISWHPEHPFVPPKDSLLDSFSDAAVKMMNQLNQMDLVSVWSNVNATVESLSRLSDNAESMIESRRGDFGRLLSDVAEAASSVKELAEKLNDNPSLIIRERKPVRLPETEE